VEALRVVLGGNALKGPRPVQRIRLGDPAGAFHVLAGHLSLAAVATLGTLVQARERRIAALLPQEGRGLDLAFTLLAASQVQGLKVRLEAFLPFLGGGELRQRGLEIGLSGRVDSQFQESA
jgi:hypothetical protein